MGAIDNVFGATLCGSVAAGWYVRWTQIVTAINYRPFFQDLRAHLRVQLSILQPLC